MGMQEKVIEILKKYKITTPFEITDEQKSIRFKKWDYNHKDEFSAKREILKAFPGVGLVFRQAK